MRFEDERYVRLYTRDTTTWLMLGFEGQAVFCLLLRKVDRTGVFDLAGSDAAEAVSAATRAPTEIVKTGLERLLSRGVVETGNDCLIVPRFIEAQEATMTPATRQKESRLRRRDELRAGLDPLARETVIYFVQSEHGGPIKIGRTDDLAMLLVNLQGSRPDKLTILAAAHGTVEQERELHRRFAATREKGEWFAPTEELLHIVRQVALTRNIDVSLKTVTNRDTSQPVTRHETIHVTPYCAVPNQTDKLKDVGFTTLSGHVSPDVVSVAEPKSNISHPPSESEAVALQAQPVLPVQPALPDQHAALPVQHTLPVQPDLLTTCPPEREVFEYWLSGWKRIVRGTRVPKLDDNRRRKIKARLREGYTVADLKRAIDGLWASDWHVENKRHDLELVCRDAPHVDRFLAEAPEPKPERPPFVPEFPDDEVATPMSPEELAEFERDFAAFATAKTCPDAAAFDHGHSSDIRLKAAAPMLNGTAGSHRP